MDRLGRETLSVVTGEQRTVLQVYCRIEVVIDDPAAVAQRAIEALREADIEWSTEQDTLPEAIADIRDDLSQALASLIEPDRMLEGVPGIQVRGGRWWAEPGPPTERFNPGFPEPDPSPPPAR
jgi:hypothetical protein